VTDPATLKQCSCPDHEGPNPLPASEFGKDRAQPGGLKSWCKPCRNRTRRAARAADPEKDRKSNRRYRKAHPEVDRRYRQANPEKTTVKNRRWWEANREGVQGKSRGYRKQLRDQVLDHYGRICACPGCGSADRLSIDHVNGDGRAHRIELFGRTDESTGMCRWLIDKGFPDNPPIQLLCISCSTSKGDGPACHIDHFGTGFKRCPCPEHEGPNPLPLSEFHRDLSTRDGVYAWCRACKNRAERAYRAEKAPRHHAA
jgi:hypothetical protein